MGLMFSFDVQCLMYNSKRKKKKKTKLHNNKHPFNKAADKLGTPYLFS